ncbi:MAG: hypothetical protein MN733_14710 [Nitrososphaera sp.]|nr:hypothetical protein [Nitrososphaera sp.]
MTDDNIIPDSMGPEEANRLIRNSDDRIFKKKDTSNRKSKAKKVHQAMGANQPIYWECPNCKTYQNGNICPCCFRERPKAAMPKPSKVREWWLASKEEVIIGLFGILAIAIMCWVAILVAMTVTYVSNNFKF